MAGAHASTATQGVLSPPVFSEGTRTGPSPVRDLGTERTDAKSVRQVWVPGGTFTIGSPGSATAPDWAANTFASEHPAHQVTVTPGHWIDATEVTVAEFAAFKAAGGYTTQANWSAEGWAWLQGMGSVPLPSPCVAQQPTSHRSANVMEWVADWWSASYYADSPAEDPTGPARGDIKIEKGGWLGPAGRQRRVHRQVFVPP